MTDNYSLDKIKAKIHSVAQRMANWDRMCVGSIILILASTLIAFLSMPMPPAATMPRASSTATYNPNLPFNLSKPAWSKTLPKHLDEVSGITVNHEGTLAWVINDEEGQLYTIDLTDGTVNQTSQFAQKGDYEGIASTDQAVVVARSDGQLYFIENDETKEFDSPLKSANNIEGLAFDAKNNRLLTACKGKAGKGKQYKKAKAIYAVQLPAVSWQPKPAIVIKLKELKNFLKTENILDIKPKRANDFAPSAISIDPLTDHVYILSSKAQMLLVVDSSGELIAAADLPRHIHMQPEGISFDAKGSMYLTNEGRNSKAKLYRFDRMNIKTTGEY